MAEPEKLECLLESKSSRSVSGWRRAAFAAFGAYLVFTAVSNYTKGDPILGIAFNLLAALFCFFVMKFEKKIYISPAGFVKDTVTWFSRHRELLRWEDVGYVTLVAKGPNMTAYVEKGVTGWKLLFTRNDIAAIDSLCRRYAPKVKVSVKEM